MKHCIQTGFNNLYTNYARVGKPACDFTQLHKYNFKYTPCSDVQANEVIKANWYVGERH